MPLNLPDDDSAPYYILGIDAKGVKGAQLAAGASLAVTSADPNTVVVTPDASPAVEPTSGLQSLASGTVSSPASPAAPNTAIAINAAVTNADGTAGISVSDTVTVTPGAAAALGEVFGAAVPVPVVAPPASRK